MKSQMRMCHQWKNEEYEDREEADDLWKKMMDDESMMGGHVWYDSIFIFMWHEFGELLCVHCC